MYLELHDGEEGNSLIAKIPNLDYDYQAEEWVQETHKKDKVIKWILYDDEGAVRCVWERSHGSLSMPDITQRSDLFTGTWEKGPKEITI